MPKSNLYLMRQAAKIIINYTRVGSRTQAMHALRSDLQKMYLKTTCNVYQSYASIHLLAIHGMLMGLCREVRTQKI